MGITGVDRRHNHRCIFHPRVRRISHRRAAVMVVAGPSVPRKIVAAVPAGVAMHPGVGHRVDTDPIASRPQRIQVAGHRGAGDKADEPLLQSSLSVA